MNMLETLYQRHHPKQRKKTPNAPKRLHKALGPKVRKLRLTQGWSQQTLAKVAGMDDGHIGEIERSEIDPSLSTLLKIAKAFHLTLSKLLQTSRPGHSMTKLIPTHTTATHLHPAKPKARFHTDEFTAIRKKLAHRIRQLRTQKGWSQERLADGSWAGPRLYGRN